MSRKNTAFIMIILTYFLIVFGGYVASSESGLGCGPEWPLCNGEVIPELEGETLIEFGHRLIGALLFIFTIYLFVKIKKESESLLEKKVAGWMLGLLVLQLVMGAIVVFYHLPSIVITVHLLIAMVFLAILLWVWRFEKSYPKFKNNTNRYWVKHLNMIVLLLFLTIGIGAYIKHQEYGLACGWISCGDNLWPVSIAETLQTLHRLLAVITAVYILFIGHKAYHGNHQLLKLRMTAACLVVLLQIALGIMTILSSVSIPLAVLHLAAGTLLFALIAEARIVLSWKK